MELKYEGKTKDVYALQDGNYLLKFKDDMTGKDGKFDPGANTVGLTVEGAGVAGLRLSAYFFKRFAEAGIPTHFISADLSASSMIVKPAEALGHGIEIICRYRAVGSFYRRYGAYVQEGQALDGFVEVTLKDDARQDPPIHEDALEMLGIVTASQFTTIKSLTKQISQIVKDEFLKKEIELYDIKLEFGYVGEQREIALIDEISGGNLRAYRHGEVVDPIELVDLFLGEY